MQKPGRRLIVLYEVGWDGWKMLGGWWDGFLMQLMTHDAWSSYLLGWAIWNRGRRAEGLTDQGWRDGAEMFFLLCVSLLIVNANRYISQNRVIYGKVTVPVSRRLLNAQTGYYIDPLSRRGMMPSSVSSLAAIITSTPIPPRSITDVRSQKSTVMCRKGP